jgi:hypothetical protein
VDGTAEAVGFTSAMTLKSSRRVDDLAKKRPSVAPPAGPRAYFATAAAGWAVCSGVRRST